MKVIVKEYRHEFFVEEDGIKEWNETGNFMRVTRVKFLCFWKIKIPFMWSALDYDMDKVDSIRACVFGSGFDFNPCFSKDYKV